MPPTALAAGDNFTAGIHFQLERGWHVYWINAGDSGEPPRVRWTLPNAVTADPLLFPSPKRLPLGPLMDFGYEDEVLFPVPMHVGADAPKSGTAAIAAKVDWLVCRESCIPGRASLSVTRPFGASAAPDAHAQQLVEAALAEVPKPLPANDTAVFQAGAKNLDH